jgi:chromosome segregation ATPase
MEELGLLEKKLIHLLEYVQKLKTENALIVQERDAAKVELDALQADYAKLFEISNNQKDEITALKNTLDKIECSMLETTTNINRFQEKEALTKMLVDDLLNSIDSLVEPEQ